MPTPSLDAVLARIDETLPQSLDRLMALLRIPSISTDPAYKADCARTAEALAEDLRSLGFDARAAQTPGHPMVVAPGGESIRCGPDLTARWSVGTRPRIPPAARRPTREAAA